MQILNKYNIDTVDRGARCKSLTSQTWFIQPTVEQGPETLKQGIRAFTTTKHQKWDGHSNQETTQ